MYERCQENVLMNGQESGSSVDAPNSLTSSSSNQGKYYQMFLNGYYKHTISVGASFSNPQNTFHPRFVGVIRDSRGAQRESDYNYSAVLSNRFFINSIFQTYLYLMFQN